MENFNCCGKSFNYPDLKRVVTKDSKVYRYCKNCCHNQAGMPDVWYGYGSGVHSEENIAYPNGHPQAGEPIPFWDKRSKAEAMKQAGVREIGDRVHGARNESHLHRKTYSI